MHGACYVTGLNHVFWKGCAPGVLRSLQRVALSDTGRPWLNMAIATVACVGS